MGQDLGTEKLGERDGKHLRTKPLAEVHPLSDTVPSGLCLYRFARNPGSRAETCLPPFHPGPRGPPGTELLLDEGRRSMPAAQRAGIPSRVPEDLGTACPAARRGALSLSRSPLGEAQGHASCTEVWG